MWMQREVKSEWRNLTIIFESGQSLTNVKKNETARQFIVVAGVLLMKWHTKTLLKYKWCVCSRKNICTLDKPELDYLVGKFSMTDRWVSWNFCSSISRQAALISVNTTGRLNSPRCRQFTVALFGLMAMVGQFRGEVRKSMTIKQINSFKIQRLRYARTYILRSSIKTGIKRQHDQ